MVNARSDTVMRWHFWPRNKMDDSHSGRANPKKVFTKEYESSAARFPCQTAYKRLILSLPLQAPTGTDVSDLKREVHCGVRERVWVGCGWGWGCCCSNGIYYLWASQGTEASLSMQKRKHSTAIATLPLSRCHISVVLHQRLKLTAKCRGRSDACCLWPNWHVMQST